MVTMTNFWYIIFNNDILLTAPTDVDCDVAAEA